MAEEDTPNFRTAKYKPLIDALRSGCCIFVGAGISRLAGYPLWKELSDRLVAEYFQARPKSKISYGRKRILEADPNSIDVMSYLKCLDPDTSFWVAKTKSIILKSREEFGRRYPDSADKIFETITFLNTNNNYFITTNIDKGLEEHLSFDEIAVVTAKESKTAIPASKSKSLYYIHGRIEDSQSWIFTREEYNENYLKDDSPTMKFLINAFQRPVLFVGYSLRDFEVLQAVYKANLLRIATGNVKTQSELPCCCFLLEGSCKRDDHLWDIQTEAVRNNYRIERIRYSIEEQGYDALFRVLENLKEVVNETRV